MKNQTKIKLRRASTVIDTAEVVGVSPSLVQKVLRGDRENEKVFTVFMELTQQKNELLESVKQLVQFL